MVRETPVIRYAAMRAHYRHRTGLKHVLPHLHFRGVLFQSYYQRSGHRFFWYYLALWVVLLGLVAAAIGRPSLAWLIPAGIGAIWLGCSAVLASGLRTFPAVLIVLPLVGVCFATGIIRGQILRLLAPLRRALAAPRGPEKP